uniref:Uncharacterized protein n=1 Tax=Amphimedon queenslandica TaxID=400682 RepID=A0A1X7TZ23_AMPQE
MSGATLTWEECEEQLLSGKGRNLTQEQCGTIIDALTEHIRNGEVERKKIIAVLEELKELINSNFFNRLDAVEKELKDQNEIIKDLKAKYEDLKAEYEKLKKLQDDLLIGQIALSLESKIVKRTLQGTGISTRFITIKNIEDALSGRKHYFSKKIFTTEEQKEAVQRNIEKLHAEFPSIIGSDMHNVIIHYKQCRNHQAHPELEIGEIRARLAESQFQNQEIIDKMLEILEALP